MKKILYFLLPLCIILSASTCEKDEPTGSLSIRFIAEYDAVPLVMNQAIKINNDAAILQRLSFFSNTSIQNATSTIALEDYRLINFSAIQDVAAAKNGVVVTLNDIAIGTYNKLNLGIGVIPSLNKKTPDNFDKTHPLSEDGDYWDSWSSYIFTKTEGRVDTAKSGKYELAFSYHTGTDEMFRNVELKKDFDIKENQNTEITVVLNAKKLLSGAKGTVSPRKEQNSHSLSNKKVAISIMDNYTEALTIK